MTQELTAEQIRYQANRDERKKQSLEYFAENKERILAQRRAKYAANKQKVLDYNRQRCEKKIESYILYRAAASAKQRGLEFNLTIEDIIVPDVCPVLGIPLVRKISRTKEAKDASPSIDRIDSSKGYIKGNVHIISWRANNIKKDSTLEELKSLVKYLESINE